jgi:hypothetical protein
MGDQRRAACRGPPQSEVGDVLRRHTAPGDVFEPLFALRGLQHLGVELPGVMQHGFQPDGLRHSGGLRRRRHWQRYPRLVGQVLDSFNEGNAADLTDECELVPVLAATEAVVMVRIDVEGCGLLTMEWTASFVGWSSLS